ncbi:glycosyltransferase [Cobetia sp. QF-1]|uniref:glycosyltransferase n=1 Tax=Cobetia sp. QF-1 TaxID=1969833 RepID=UPI001130E869|nr:glycosyltransferase [Cobetia sp. QF-1]
MPSRTVTKQELLADGLPSWVASGDTSSTTDIPPSNGERILYVLTLQSGGTPQTNQDLMRSFASRAECLVLRCRGVELTLYYFHCGQYILLDACRLTSSLRPLPHSSSEYDQVVAKWLTKYRVTIVHVRHMAWQSLGLIASAKHLQIPVVFSFHDYYTVCPSVKLLDEKKQFCGGRCSLSSGECSQELWASESMPALKFNAVYKWQQQYARALILCDAFVATTDSVRQLITDVFPALEKRPFEIIPHGRDFSDLSLLAVPPEPNQVLRVLVPGFLAVSKGRDVLLELASHPHLTHVEWHVLGLLIDTPPTLIPENVVVHGVYEREEFSIQVRKIKPHLGAVLSIWPETWCHTLTELWSVGLPVLGFNLGAVGERLAKTQGGWRVEKTSSDAMAVKLLEASETEAWHRALEHVCEWQRVGQTSCTEMAEAYWMLYQRVLCQS